MDVYYVNDVAQANGDHEVHNPNCTFLPEVQNRTYLGVFATCQEAVDAAKEHYDQVNGCVHCCKDCHTG